MAINRQGDLTEKIFWLSNITQITHSSLTFLYVHLNIFFPISNSCDSYRDIYTIRSKQSKKSVSLTFKSCFKNAMFRWLYINLNSNTPKKSFSHRSSMLFCKLFEIELCGLFCDRLHWEQGFQGHELRGLHGGGSKIS